MNVKSTVLTLMLLTPTAALAGPLTLGESSSSLSASGVAALSSDAPSGLSSDPFGLESSSQPLGSAFDAYHPTQGLTSSQSIDSLLEYLAMTFGASQPFTPRKGDSVMYASGLFLIPWNDPKFDTETPQPVPEPATLLLLGSGMAALAARKKLAARRSR